MTCNAISSNVMQFICDTEIDNYIAKIIKLLKTNFIIMLTITVMKQSQSLTFLFRKKIYIEHQNILTAIHDQD